MEKIIDYFYINEKAHYRKDYAYTSYKIEIAYALRPGDKIYSLSYRNRGPIEYNTTILDITDEGIKITSEYDEVGYKIVPWIEEDKECRVLEFTPFPLFKEGVTRKTFKKLTKSIEDFALYKYNYNPGCNKTEKIEFGVNEINRIKSYTENFKNINPTLEQLIKLEEGQYRFVI